MLLLILLLSLNNSNLEQYQTLKQEQTRLKRELRDVTRQERKLKKYLQKNVYATVEHILAQPIEIGEKRKLIRTLLTLKLYKNRNQKRFIIKAIKNLPLLLIQRARNRAIKISKKKSKDMKEIISAWQDYETLTQGTKYHSFAMRQLKKYQVTILPHIPKPVDIKAQSAPKPLPKAKPLIQAPLFRGMLINHTTAGTSILQLKSFLKQPSVKEIILIFTPCPSGKELLKLKKLQQQQLPTGRYLLIVSMDQTDETIKRCQKEAIIHQISIPIFKDPYHLIPHLYQLEQWPSLIQINQQGIITNRDKLSNTIAHDITQYINHQGDIQ